MSATGLGLIVIGMVRGEELRGTLWVPLLIYESWRSRKGLEPTEKPCRGLSLSSVQIIMYKYFYEVLPSIVI